MKKTIVVERLLEALSETEKMRKKTSKQISKNTQENKDLPLKYKEDAVL